jgi:hypothetical protein
MINADTAGLQHWITQLKIEQLVKEFKTHHCTMDFEWRSNNDSFITIIIL